MRTLARQPRATALATVSETGAPAASASLNVEVILEPRFQVVPSSAPNPSTFYWTREPQVVPVPLPALWMPWRNAAFLPAEETFAAWETGDATGPDAASVTVAE